MKKKLGILKHVLIMLAMTCCCGPVGYCQTDYNVDMDNRNMAIDLNHKAQEHFNADRYKEAAMSLAKSISTDSLLRETYLLIYQTWLNDKSLKETVFKALKKGRRIFNDDDELCFYLAEIHRDNYELPEAVLEYTNASNYAKRNGEGFYLVHYYYFNRANCLLQMKMYDGALVDYDYALKLKPNFAAAYLNRGVCLYKKGHKKEACKSWNQALELGCDHSTEYLNKYCR